MPFKPNLIFASEARSLSFPGLASASLSNIRRGRKCFPVTAVATTLSIMTFSIMTFSIMTFSIMTFSIMTFSIIGNVTQLKGNKLAAVLRHS
jgi:hypothetical protein